MRDVPDWCVEAQNAVMDAHVLVETPFGPQHPGLLIAIDGRTLVGKTKLARYLSWAVGIAHIECDMFLVGHETEYSHRYEDLSRVVESASTGLTSKSLIVESVTVLRVLERIGCRPDFLIYTYNDEDFDEEHGRARDMLEYEATYQPGKRANLVLRIPVTDPI